VLPLPATGASPTCPLRVKVRRYAAPGRRPDTAAATRTPQSGVVVNVTRPTTSGANAAAGTAAAGAGAAGTAAVAGTSTAVDATAPAAAAAASERSAHARGGSDAHAHAGFITTVGVRSHAHTPGGSGAG